MKKDAEQCFVQILAFLNEFDKRLSRIEHHIWGMEASFEYMKKTFADFEDRRAWEYNQSRQLDLMRDAIYNKEKGPADNEIIATAVKWEGPLD